jgi:hypothetical protein
MNPPCLAAQLPEAATASDPPVRLTYRESLFLFHIFFLAYNSKAESWTRNPLRPRRPWPNHSGRRLPSSGDGRHSGRTTTQPAQISLGDQFESRWGRLSGIGCTPAPMTSGTKERLADRQAIYSDPRDGRQCQRGVSGGRRRVLPQTSALLRSLDLQDVRKMADFPGPLTRQELDDEGGKREGGRHTPYRIGAG